MDSNKLHKNVPPIQTVQDEFDVEKNFLQFDEISSLSTNYSVFSDFYTEYTIDRLTIPGIAECSSTESSRSNCSTSSSLSSTSNTSKNMETIDASPILVSRNGRDRVDFMSDKKTPYTRLKIDTKSSPDLPFALISPSPLAADARYPSIEVSQSVETRSQNEENSFPFFSTFSSPFQTPPNLVPTNVPVQVPKHVHDVISKLVQSNHELNQKIETLEQTQSQDETQTHDNYSFGKEFNNQNQVTVLYSSSNDVDTSTHNSNPRSISPLPILPPHLDNNGDSLSVTAGSMSRSNMRNMIHFNEDQMNLQHEQKEALDAETTSIILMTNLLKQKDLQIHALESKVEQLEKEFTEQSRKWREEKERLEIETSNTINEIRQGSITVLMNTKQHVHSLLREVEEYKLRCAKLGASEINCKNMFEETVVLIDSEKDNTELFGDANVNESSETIESDTAYKVKDREPTIDPMIANSSHIEKLNKKIESMEHELKTLRKQKAFRQDGYVNFHNFDCKDMVLFEGRDDSQLSPILREGQETCVTEFIRENTESRIQCVQNENNLSLFTMQSNYELDNLRQECNKYKQEVIQSKVLVSELMEENMECLERLACMGTKLLVHGIGKGGKKARRNQMMAIAKAAGDLERIRKTRQSDDTDSLMNHTGYSEDGSDTSDKDNTVIKFKFKAQYKLPEMKEDACEIDPLLTRDNTCNWMRKTSNPQKRKSLKISFRKKLNQRKK